MIPLSNRTLDILPPEVLRPEYDRSRLTPGIVHIGLGNFQRAHQAWYLHRLMQQGVNHDWAIVGAGVRSSDAVQRKKLRRQDYLSTLIELDPNGTSAEVIGSMIDFAPVDKGNASLIQQMADPAIRIVSLTITEGGYYTDPFTKHFNDSHPDIQHDLTHPESPRTVFGTMVAALKRRRAQGFGPFTGQSCDNIQSNGNTLRQAVISIAQANDPPLAEWIDAHCTFPNSMVDCIVPVTGANEIAQVQAMGIDDAAPVTHESFRQWIIEDQFCSGRPEWERVGAVFSEQVSDYEMMKMRVLNAGHQIIVNLGELLSIETIADCMAQPLIRAFFRKIQCNEILPQVRTVPNITKEEYLSLIERRFSNATIADTTRRVAYEGSSRHPGFVLPVVRDGLKSGTPIEGLALVEALWARMCEGQRENGTVIESNDPLWATLQATAKAARERPRVWLEQNELYGDLIEANRFVHAFERWLARLWTDGCQITVEAYMDGVEP